MTWGILHLCGMVHPGLRFVAEAWASYQILAACELRRQSLAVARAFSKGGLVAAREAVGLIVGRDTSVLDEQALRAPPWKRWRRTRATASSRRFSTL